MRRVRAAILALVVGACTGGGPTSTPVPARTIGPVSGWINVREEDAGLSVAYPAGWHVASSPLVPASAASEIFAVGSKALRPGTTASCAGIPIHAIEDLGAQDALVRISETSVSAPPRRGLFFSGDVRTRTPPSCARPGRVFYGTVAFEDAGRDLRAFVAWGSKASEATKRDVFAILDSVQVDPAPTAPKRPRCGVVDVGGARYGTVMEPSRAGPGDQVVLSGPPCVARTDDTSLPTDSRSGSTRRFQSRRFQMPARSHPDRSCSCPR
jgi:hypothetical protein